MIYFDNNFQLDFCCASGALGFFGKGYWWESPFFWFGLIDPTEFTVIAKTVTLNPRWGNHPGLKFWRYFQFLRNNGYVNDMGLPNPGLDDWIEEYYYKKIPYKMIMSVSCDDPLQIRRIIWDCNGVNGNGVNGIVGVELDLSCPNVDNRRNANEIRKIIDSAIEESNKPIIVKLGVQNSVVEICKKCKPAAWDLINSVPWKTVFPDKPSPLRSQGGGVSGTPIKQFARQTLIDVLEAGVTVPIISGGGIDSEEEAEMRFTLGASAVSFGTLFIKKPWLPNQIIRSLRKKWASSM